MYSNVCSGTWEGVDGILIEVEADVSNGLPMFDMAGYLSSEVKEARKRVRTAIRNLGYQIPPKRITVNLSPADIRKSGTAYDLAVALAVLMSAQYLPKPKEKVLCLGEVGLNGDIKAVRGVLPVVIEAKKAGIHFCIVPEENEKEGNLVDGILCFGVRHVKEAAEVFSGFSKEEVIKHRYELLTKKMRAPNKEIPPFDLDFSDLVGHGFAKRAIEIAASGHHNLLMIGPPGSGKSALAKRIPGIMPSMSYEEKLEVTKIYSISQKIKEMAGLMEVRPFRSPHHSITAPAMAGGGISTGPGEISLSHHGLLFLDELPLFSHAVLELLRQPMEEKEIYIARARKAVCYPADFMLVAAMNPCPCGYAPNPDRCFCTERQKNNYRNKISGPLLDRIDLMVRVDTVPYEERLESKKEESSQTIRERVELARNLQRKRYEKEKFCVNSALPENRLDKYCILDEEAKNYLDLILKHYDLSYRGHVRILKVSRTIADLEGSEEIKMRHLEEAVIFRMGWNNEKEIL